MFACLALILYLVCKSSEIWSISDTDTKLEIFVDGDAIVLKKHRPAGSCDFCGEVDEQAIQFGGYCICSACRRKLSAL